MASVASRSRKALASRSLPRLYFEGAAIVGVLATTVFLFNPGIDIIVSGAFYSGDGFLGAQDLGARSVRLALIWMTNAAVAVCLAGLLVTSLFRRAWLTLRFSQWLFIAVCYAVGPGVVANLIFKDHWGRARPKDIVEFGGEKAFSLPLIPSDQCLSSCSFLSSETSSVFMVLFAAALVAPEAGGAAISTAAVLCGAVTGLIRISQGAHFMSDVVFSGVFMALTAAALYHLLFSALHAEALDRQ